uniref:GPR158/179 extracellular domain-containing protein n=1 Tax=Anopheles culicifacies TaxID=139723 RepID=A0A182M7C6_9DIPT
MGLLWRSYGLFAVLTLMGVLAQYEWQPKDAFDEIKVRFDKVNGDNCPILPPRDLTLPEDSVSHIPDIKDVNINPVFPNRTALLHLHNMALSRAFFWSYILQSRFIRPAINDTYDPGMMYYFLSTVADVSSNKHINASAIYFAPNSSFSSSYRGFFNKTFPRFAPRTYREDDFNDPIHLEKISTLNTFYVRDLGAFPPDSALHDYTIKNYHINEWYNAWLPDNVDKRHDTKTTYQVEIRYANNTNETFTFHGPPGADEDPGPVKFTKPYFDCRRSNKWLVAAVTPIADIYPRHTQFRHIEYPTYTAVSVLEMDFERIDINQCPKGEGNKGPNIFADTARCKKETTECEPIDGWGFRRGGYQCRCKPGYRLPGVVRRPYLGEILERASDEQFYNGFDCMKIGWVQKVPIKWFRAPTYVREQYLNRYYEYKNYTTGPSSLHSHKLNINEVLKFILGVNPRSCKNYHPQDLVLTGEFAYEAQKQFENEAKMAIRLANFISAFLQISDPTEVYSGKRVADKPLTEDQMMGETLALVLGNTRIWSAATMWDRRKFPNRTLFGPYAYKRELNTRKFNMEDLARYNKTGEEYIDRPYFRLLKQRWATNFDSLEKYYLKIRLRHNETGEYAQRFEHFPNFYHAATMDHGYWTTPEFDCQGYVKKWLITYAVPFFGWDSLKAKLEFKGIVAVSMNMLQLDINQCPDDYYEPNAFKNTHKCDEKSSYCVPILGRGYETGGYKCECLQGFEYPYEDLITYYDGQLVEAEFENIVNDKESRFETFKCRLAGAAALQVQFTMLAFVMLFGWILLRRNQC